MRMYADFILHGDLTEPSLWQLLSRTRSIKHCVLAPGRPFHITLFARSKGFCPIPPSHSQQPDAHADISLEPEHMLVPEHTGHLVHLPSGDVAVAAQDMPLAPIQDE